MRRDNQSSVSEFILLGLPIQPEEQVMYYALFLAIYLTSVLGNLTIILLIRLDSHLHTPMYFFLSYLAFTDVSFSSVTAPKILMNMVTQCKSISFAGCVSQLSSSDTTVNELIILITGSPVIILPFICSLVSYGHIGVTILKIPSIKGIFKALSTCDSHLSVVGLYYGTIIGLYFVPYSKTTNDKDVIVAALYNMVTPMLNHFIYSLRNQDMKVARGNTFSRKTVSA
uniref:Olfactory receptor 50-like n=1 Tax=Castor canadensis TaxID=51338 RepID=A0A8B7TQI6_CASCN|nr:olfactory receptor 50-like [Castor canadensis]